MKIKKIIILISFVALALIGGRAFACSIYYTADCPVAEGHIVNQNGIAHPAQAQAAYGADTPSVQPLYTPVLPQVYGTEATFIDNSPMYVVQTGGVVGGPVAPVVTLPPAAANPNPAPQAAYIPASPIIFNGNGTYTEQNTGKVTGTPTKTTGTTTTTTSTETEGGLWSNIFGTNKKSLFSNGTDTTEVDANMKALVNSKGLAMGTNGASCQSGVQYLIMYKNITGTPLSNVAVRISLPTGVTPTNTSGGAYSERDNTITLFLGSLAVNQEGQILIDTKATGPVSGVARTELVYTLPNQTQNMIVSYAFGDNTCVSGSAIGASAIGAGGSGLFGGTLLGWLFFALFVSAFVYLVRFFLNKKTADHGHGHAVAHAH